VGAGPAGQAQAFLVVGEEFAVGVGGVVVPGVPVAAAHGPTVGTAGTLGPDEVFRGHAAEEGVPAVPS